MTLSAPFDAAPVDALRTGQRRCLRVAAGIVAALLLVVVVDALPGVGGPRPHQLVRDAVSSAVYVLVAGIVALRAATVPTARLGWVLLATGIALYGVGNLVWAIWVQHLPNVPIPSICDVLWLSLYPLSYAGLVVLGRPEGKTAAGVWLDGVVAGLGMAALGAVVVFPGILASASGPWAAVVTNLAYPVADLLLAALVTCMLALRSWRPTRQWALLAGGFLLLAAADAGYLLAIADGASTPGQLTNLLYLLGVAALAAASWQRDTPAETSRSTGWSMLLVPGVFSLIAVGLIVFDHLEGIGGLGFSLAVATLLGALLRTVFTFHDVRRLVATRHEALTDELTSLGNRRLFLRRLEEGLETARADGGTLAVLFIDLDRFKEVNDTLGHEAGDALLVQVGRRLRDALRPDDTVARLGGDEFGVILPAPSSEAAAVRAADKVVAALTNRPVTVGGVAVHTTASVGVTLFPAHGATAAELMRRADIAMYQAKSDGSQQEVYATASDTTSPERLALVEELRLAINRGELELHFQPKADAATRAVTGVEALVRWQHPRQGLVPPATFIPLADRVGLARPLTRLVLELALAQSRAWADEGRDLQVAINVTAADLMDSAFPEEVHAALRRHGVAPERIVLEITETSVLSDPVRIRNVLGRLGELGVSLSLDDFGTGYSSLTHLRTLPVSEVKIDRSFVSRMDRDSADAAIVQSTVQLVHGLGMRVVAEGVEDQLTWDRLEQIGCDQVQGYVLSRPVPAAELDALLAAH